MCRPEAVAPPIDPAVKSGRETGKESAKWPLDRPGASCVESRLIAVRWHGPAAEPVEMTCRGVPFGQEGRPLRAREGIGLTQ